MLGTGLHGSHHLDGVLEIAIGEVQRLFDGGVASGTSEFSAVFTPTVRVVCLPVVVNGY